MANNFIPKEKTHECLICHNFRGFKTKLWNHVENVHRVSKDQYMWQYVYCHEGTPKCLECGNSLHYNKWNRDLQFCSTNCMNINLHREHPEYYRDEQGKPIGLNKAWNDQNSELNSKRLKELWKNPEFRNKMSDVSRKYMNSDEKRNKILMESHGVNFEGKGYIYLFRFKDYCKLGFSTSILARWKYFNYPEIIKILEFRKASDAFDWEFDFHLRHIEDSLYEGTRNTKEFYPISMIPIILQELGSINENLISNKDVILEK